MSSPKSANPFAALDALPAAAIPAAIGFLSAKLMAVAPAASASSAEATPDALLSPAEAAKLLGVSRKFIYSRVKELGGVRLKDERGRVSARSRIRFRRTVILGRLSR